MDKKRCVTCGQEKHITDFEWSSAYYDNRLPWCKKCGKPPEKEPLPPKETSDQTLPTRSMSKSEFERIKKEMKAEIHEKKRARQEQYKRELGYASASGGTRKSRRRKHRIAVKNWRKFSAELDHEYAMAVRALKVRYLILDDGKPPDSGNTKKRQG